MARDALRSQVAFSMVPVWVLERCSSRAVHVYALLMRHANRERRAWPKTERLAADMGLSLRTVERAIAELRNAHALQTTRRHAVNGAVLGLDFILVQLDPHADSLPAISDGKDGGLPATGVVTIPPPVAGSIRKNQIQYNQIQEQTHARLAFAGTRIEVPKFLHEKFTRQLGAHGAALFDLLAWYPRLDAQDDGPIVGNLLTFVERAFADETKRVFGSRQVGAPRLAYADWTCPHEPRCTHPSRCQQLQDIAAEKARASA